MKPFHAYSLTNPCLSLVHYFDINPVSPIPTYVLGLYSILSPDCKVECHVAFMQFNYRITTAVDKGKHFKVCVGGREEEGEVLECSNSTGRRYIATC